MDIINMNNLLITIGSTLIAVIGLLWGLWTAAIKKDQQECQQELKDSEAEVKRQTEVILQLTSELSSLKAILDDPKHRT